MRKIPLILQILMGFVLGTLGGLFLSEWGSPQLKENITGIVSPFGNLLVAMLKMVVFPMILFSLIHGAASLPLRKSGKVGANWAFRFMRGRLWPAWLSTQFSIPYR